MKKTNLRKLLLVGVLAIGSLGFSAVASAAITQDQAKAIVMKEVPNGQITKMELDYDHGRQVYEIEVMDGNVERDFDIDAETGTIVKMDMDHYHGYKYKNCNQNMNMDHYHGYKYKNYNQNMNMAQPKVTYEQAKGIALKQSKNGKFKEIKLKTKNGVQVYDVEIAEGIMDREILIDANTGAILRDKKDF